MMTDTTENNWVDEGDTSYDEGHEAGYEAGWLAVADELSSLQQQLKEAREIIKDYHDATNQRAIQEGIFHPPSQNSVQGRARSFLSKTEKTDE
jgi:hypothetical protein